VGVHENGEHLIGLDALFVYQEKLENNQTIDDNIH